MRGQAGVGESKCESESESEEEDEGERGREGDGENGLSRLSGDELAAALIPLSEKAIRKSIKKDIEMKRNVLISFSLSLPMKSVLFILFFPSHLPAPMAGFRKTTID